MAGLLLTSRADVRIRSEVETNSGQELLVEIHSGEVFSSRLFVVYVMGTKGALLLDWVREATSLSSTAEDSIYLPTCFFTMDVQDNRSCFAWIAEPVVESNVASLRMIPPGTFFGLNPSDLNKIVDQVKTWYEAIPRHQLTIADQNVGR